MFDVLFWDETAAEEQGSDSTQTSSEEQASYPDGN